MRVRTNGVVLALLITAALPIQASAWRRGHAQIFATLPAGASGPEGLEVGPDGHVYVTTFGFTSTGAATGEGQLYVFDHHGDLVRQVPVSGSTPHLLGLRFHPTSGALLVIDFGGGQVLSVDPLTGSATPFMTLPSTLPHPNGSGLNDLTFDQAGNVYVSDSTQGIVWTTGPQGGLASAWVDSALLRTTGVPPFGANGLRFNNEQTKLFVANTGNDTILQVPVTAGTSGPVAGTPSVFTNSINGADGLLVDEDDNLWVVANQADEVVVVDPTGKAISKLGDFGGLAHGAPVQLLFPASLRFFGRELLVTNLSLDLRLFDPSFQSVDSRWCAQVSRYTIVKLRARLRGFGDRFEDWFD